jgi:hypothetical protein
LAGSRVHIDATDRVRPPDSGLIAVRGAGRK